MIKNDAWWWALLAVIVAGIFAHAYLPRYEWREIRDPNALSTRPIRRDKSGADSLYCFIDLPASQEHGLAERRGIGQTDRRQGRR